MNNPKVYIVTPIHNGIDYTLEFLKSFRKVDYTNYQIIIVDDGSTDNSSEKIKDSFPDVIILKGDGNLWWSGATNKGAEYAINKKADFVLTINNDVEVEPDFLAELVDCAQKNPNSLVGSKINYIDNKDKVWYFGASFNNKSIDIEPLSGTNKDFNKFVKTDFLTGMSVLIPINVFSKIGFFDTRNFPQYFGDSDFSLRAKKAGFNLIVTPESTVYINVESSWVSKQLKSLKITFFYYALFSLKSQYNIFIRYKFYKRYWLKNSYMLAFFRFYLHFFYRFFSLYFRQKFGRLKRFIIKK